MFTFQAKQPDAQEIQQGPDCSDESLYDKCGMSQATRRYMEKERLIYPQPKTEKHRHSNKIFVDIYKSAYVSLQTQFPIYFRAQRSIRWSFDCAMKQAIKKREQMMFQNVTTGGSNLQKYLKTPAILHKIDQGKVEHGIDGIDKLIQTLSDAKATLVCDWKAQLTGDNMPRKHAKGEHATYYEDSCKQVANLVSSLENDKQKLNKTLDSIKQKYHTAHGPNRMMKRKMKENRRHASTRKQQRRNARAVKIVVALGRHAFEDDISPEITGNFQIGISERASLVKILDDERKDDFLESTLLYMRDEAGIFDEGGWSVVEEWGMDNGLF